MENEIGRSGSYNQQGNFSKRKHQNKNYNMLSNKLSHSSIAPDN